MEGDQLRRIRCVDDAISIHTFLTEGDHTLRASAHHQTISIHTFLTEGDFKHPQLLTAPLLFQSTPSLRKVTSHYAHNLYFF